MEISYEIRFPLPPKALSTNYRGHTRSKGHRQAVRNYRALCAILLREAKIPALSTVSHPARVTYDLEFFYGPRQNEFDRGYRARDESNALGSVKSLLDALQDAEIVPNDSQKHLALGTVKLHTTKSTHGGKSEVLLRLRKSND